MKKIVILSLLLAMSCEKEKAIIPNTDDPIFDNDSVVQPYLDTADLKGGETNGTEDLVNGEFPSEVDVIAGADLDAAIDIGDELPCQPVCTNLDCGDDGCGGSCGECMEGTYCSGGICIPGQCEPDCEGKVCGDDGCGNSCGECIEGTYCSDGTCVPFQCEPNCEGKECGDDGCGDLCGQCPEGTYCSEGTCIPGQCEPDCEGKECGDDGCGDLCGSCAPDYQCVAGLCEKICVPDCFGKNCGDDGCGGSCGTCPLFAPICENGICTEEQCVPNCMGKVCGDDGCGNSCGTCLPFEICSNGSCSMPPSLGECPFGGQAYSASCFGTSWEGCCDADVLFYC